MKKEFFANLSKILYNNDTQDKFQAFFDFYDDFKSENLIFDHENEVLLKDNLHPSLSVKKAIKMRRVSTLKSNEALAKMLHSIAHIEFSAINLALDSAYRFRFLPRNYYKDWLEVADDEIKHFNLLEKALNELGYKYSDFAVHDNLESALKATATSLKYRMAVVHRGLEARGLDANPFVVKKLQNYPHSLKTFLEQILKIILDDEITHVHKGDIWWKFAKDDEDDFLQICKDFKEFSLAGKILHRQARKEVGFSEEELNELEAFYSQKRF